MKKSKQKYLIGWAVGVSILGLSAVATLPLSSDVMAAEKAVTAEEVTRARALQLEGTQLQLKGDLEGAIGMYRASNTLNPNPRIESLVATLERQIAIKQNSTTATPAATPATAPAEAVATVSAPKTTAEMIKQAVKEDLPEDTPEASAATTVVETIEQAVPPQETVPVQHTPASPEEALIYEYVDWMLQLFDPLGEAGIRLDTNRNYTITQSEGKYQVRLEPFRVNFDNEAIVDGGPVIFTLQPEGAGRLVIDMQVSPVWSITEEGESTITMAIKNHTISGVWDRATHFFDKADLQLDEIVFTHKTEEGQVAIQQLLFGMALAPGENGLWQEGLQGSLKGLSLDAEDVKFSVNNIGIFSSLTGTDYGAYKNLRKDFQEMGEAIDEEMEIGEAKVLFTGLDSFTQLISGYDTKITVDGVAVDVGDIMGMEGMNSSFVVKKDSKTGKFMMDGNSEMRGISYAEEKSEENPQPVVFSLKQMRFTDNVALNPIPPTFFAEMFTVLEKAEAMEEEQATEDYLAVEGMSIAKKVVALLAKSSGVFTLNGLSINNVMPDTVTLGEATIGGGYTGSTGQGSNVDLQFGFSDFKGVDLGANIIPQAANLNFGLANIPSILELIADPTALAQGEMEQIQGQMMMNGMGAVMGSALAFSLKDSFVAFPTTRLNMDLAAAVNGAAKFMSTGTMKLAIENPDAFMQTAKDLGADPSMLQMLSSFTALANRADENGKVVDRIDAKVDQEGKVFVNNKDVTLMFFPEQSAPEGQQPAPAQQ